MTSALPTVCQSCVHKFADSHRCDAYPDKDIPLNYFEGEDHFEVRDDQDNEIVHELNPDLVREFADYLLVFPVARGSFEYDEVVDRFAQAGVNVPPGA